MKFIPKPSTKWHNRITPQLTVHCMVQYSLQFYNRKTAPHHLHSFYILIYLFFNIKYINNSLISLVFNQKKKFNYLSKYWLGKPTQNKEKLVQEFKTLPKTKRKISFELGKKSPKFEKCTSFKLHLIHRTAHVTTKMRCGAVMILAKSHCKVCY